MTATRLLFAAVWLACFSAHGRAEGDGAAARKKLGSLKRETRIEGARECGLLGAAGSEAIPDLLKMLGEGDSAASKAAGRALAQIGTPAVESLIRELDGALEAAQRHDILMILGAMGRDAGPAAEKTARLLLDRDPQIRLAAALALGAMHEKAEPALAKIGDALSDPEPQVRIALADALYQIGPPSVPVLSRATKWSDPAIRALMYSTLGRFKRSDDAASLLKAALKDEVPAVRAVGAGALLRLGKMDEGDAGLWEALKDRDSEIQSLTLAAMVGLGALADDQKLAKLHALHAETWFGVGPLSKAPPQFVFQEIHQPSAIRRTAALLAVAQYGGDPKSLMPVLKKLVTDNDRVIAGAAWMAGGKVDPKNYRDADKAAELLHAAVRQQRGASDLGGVLRVQLALSVLALLDLKQPRLSKLARDRLGEDVEEIFLTLKDQVAGLDATPTISEAINATAFWNLGSIEPFASLAAVLDRTVRKSKDERIAAYAVMTLGNGVMPEAPLQPALEQIRLRAIPKAPIKELIAERVISLETGRFLVRQQSVREQAVSMLNMDFT